MKKNILSVLILALLVVNIALTGIMLFSVSSTNKKTAALVNNIATVMNLELMVPGEEEKPAVSLADTQNHDMAGSMTIPLSISDDGRQAYIMFDVSLAMNIKHKDYKTYGTVISERESMIKDVITSVVGKYTMEECSNNFESIKQEILAEIQELFQSDFIYKVAITNIKYG
ncbi:MAG: flagellar basal body-associated FliL family protein [Lachnospiraceae bacterium]|nr:flagellar basal body-associated FliL family protein [Lachnospiraceae bacterium]